MCIPLDIFEDVEYTVVNIFQGDDFIQSETDIVSVVGYPFW